MCARPTTPFAQDQTITLDHWTTRKPGPKFMPIDGGMRVSGGRGWVAADGYYTDFVLRLRYRAVTDEAMGAVLVRANPPWPLRPAWPTSGYRVVLQAGDAGADIDGSLIGYRTRKAVVPDDASRRPLRGESDWHDLEVRCVAAAVTVVRDGAVLISVTGQEPTVGEIGIEGSQGTFEFADVRVTALDRWGTEGGALRLPAAGIVGPRAVKRVQPQFAPAAMRGKSEGMAILEIVIEKDGTVGPVRVLESLDPDFDKEAVVCAKQWRFNPATRDGEPVVVLATLQLSFQIRLK